MRLLSSSTVRIWILSVNFEPFFEQKVRLCWKFTHFRRIRKWNEVSGALRVCGSRRKTTGAPGCHRSVVLPMAERARECWRRPGPTDIRYTSRQVHSGPEKKMMRILFFFRSKQWRRAAAEGQIRSVSHGQIYGSGREASLPDGRQMMLTSEMFAAKFWLRKFWEILRNWGALRSRRGSTPKQIPLKNINKFGFYISNPFQIGNPCQKWRVQTLSQNDVRALNDVELEKVNGAVAAPRNQIAGVCSVRAPKETNHCIGWRGGPTRWAVCVNKREMKWKDDDDDDDDDDGKRNAYITRFWVGFAQKLKYKWMKCAAVPQQNWCGNEEEEAEAEEEEGRRHPFTTSSAH